MKCLLATCGNTIPKTRDRSAKYCSDECYYMAKKDRSNQRYAMIKAPGEELKRNERILGYLYSITELRKPIVPSDLESLRFNFTISSGEHMDNDRRLFKVIGKYAYYIDANKNLFIWKLK